MRALNFTDCAVRVDERGAWLSLLLDKGDIPMARKFVLGKKDKSYTAELKEYHEKRSLRANKYLWELLGKLAEALKTTDGELYLFYVQKYGIYKQFCLTEDEYKTFKVMWSSQGKAWPVERADYDQSGERFEVHAYYGSSVYNTKQMSRLIDAVVDDCENVGIETLPPDKLALLKEDWNAH